MIPDPSSSDHRAPLPHVRVEIAVEIPSDVRYIERVVELVRRQCEELDYAPRQVALNVPVALTEALSNAILRGNHEDLSKNVRIHASVDPQTLVLEIADEGSGFDLEAETHDPTSPERLECEDGRGLFLMRKLMDRVERVDGDGNIVRMMLRRAG